MLYAPFIIEGPPFMLPEFLKCVFSITSCTGKLLNTIWHWKVFVVPLSVTHCLYTWRINKPVHIYALYILRTDCCVLGRPYLKLLYIQYRSPLMNSEMLQVRN